MPPRQPPHTFKDANKAAVAASKAKKPRQSKYEEVFVVTTSCEPTPGELAKLYSDIRSHILEVSAAVIKHNVAFEEPVEGYAQGFNPVIHNDVPVMSPYSERFTYFLIEFLGRVGEPTLQFAIRHDNLYCVGFRALYPTDDPRTKQWYSFGSITMMRSVVFPDVVKSNYPEGYNKMEAVSIYPEVFRNVYLHFALFHLDPSTTEDGFILKDTLFVMVCEGSRYKFAQQLTYAGMRAVRQPVKLSTLMWQLIKNWGNLSLAILMLWLAQEEERLALGPAARADANAELAKYEKYQDLITLRDLNGVFQLDLLAGRSLFALLHSDKVMRKIHMRRMNFARAFPKKLPHVDY